MNDAKSVRLGLRLHGLIVFMAAIAHTGWHWFLPTYADLKKMSPIQIDTLYLFNWSIALCLLFLSILSWAASIDQSLTLRQARRLSTGLFCFWVCRLALEFAYPVQIPLLILNSPSFFIKVLISACIAILMAPEVYTRLNTKRVNRSQIGKAL